MANIMSLKSLRNKPSRNGFDLSSKRNFTAKAGELLPVGCWEVLPADSFVFDLKSLSRTQPLNTAAFARIREYFDFYFVPYNLLWNKSNTVLTQMYDNSNHALSLTPDLNQKLSDKVPYTTYESISKYLNNHAVDKNKLNLFGFNTALQSAKLLEYLGYGEFYKYAEKSTNTFDSNSTHNLQVNLYSLLAYQKIYNDYFRQTNWEKSVPSTYNLDFIKGTNDLFVDYSSPSLTDYYTCFEMRYCNWQQDMFHGVLPRAQYGDVSAVPISFFDNSGLSDGSVSVPVTGGRLYTNGVVNQNASTEIDVKSGGNSALFMKLRSDFNVLALRQAEFLQRWKEITQSGNRDYKEQIEKHWNISPSEALSERCTYLGGITNNLDINEVVNNNITGDNAADIAGKGVSVGNGQIRFQSNGQYGVIMCIYHCLPLIDYTADLISPKVTKVNSTDFAIPEFDRVGMQPVPVMWASRGKSFYLNQPQFGYAPRYIEYKTDVDISMGAFRKSLQNWVIRYNTSDMNVTNDNDLNVNQYYSWQFFKVNPHCLDSLFAVNAGDSVDTDPFLCSTFFDVKAVRNLDVDGLPY